MSTYGTSPTVWVEIRDPAGVVVGGRTEHPEGVDCAGVPFGEQCVCGAINWHPAAPPLLIEADLMDERALIGSAAARRTVLLRNGRRATLVRWRSTRLRRGRVGNQLDTCRVEYPSGSHATLPCTDVLAVSFPAGPRWRAPGIVPSDAGRCQERSRLTGLPCWLPAAHSASTAHQFAEGPPS